MRCSVCGAENREGTRFCTQCGSSLGENAAAISDAAVRMSVDDSGKKKQKWFFACVIVIACLLCAAGGYFYKANQAKKEYEQLMQDAEMFVEKEDYERAKDSYYLIISRFPEKTETYISLLNVCILQDDFEEADKVLAQAETLYEDKVSKHASQGEIFEKQLTECRQAIAERQETIENAVSYTWHIEPTIEADNIDYATDASYYERSLNEMGRQYSSPYAVIQRGESLGLIDMDGDLKADMQYESIVNYAGDYCLVKKGAKDAQDTYVIPPLEEDDELINIWEWVYGYVVYNWYYNDGVHEVHENDAAIRLEEFPPSAFPIRKSEGVLDSEGKNWEKQLGGSPYAICSGDKLATDFIYEECGASSCGLMAVCQDGKWGYTDENGETVIPIEYDALWKYYYDPLKQCRINFEDTGKIFPEKMQEYCYAASEGYVPLCRDGIWELRDTSGKVAIPAGIFEEIRPLYNGKCWVKQDGKWGVIEIQEDQATDKKQEENLISYSWYLDPSVEADNIDYVTDADYNERSLNELCCQYSSPYAVVRQGDSLGLIDMDGNLKTDMQYESIVNYVGDYCLVEKGAEEGEGTYVMSSDNDDLINILDLGFGYVVYNWYYCDGLHEPNEFDETFRMDDPPQVGIPIRNSEELIDEEGGSWEEQLKDSRYAIWVWDKLTTDFVYDKCGSSSCGLMAVCRDGKWGYVNEWGETVIPMEYDASWKYYSNPYEMLELEVEYGGKILPEEMQEYCYAASEGYVPLCKAGVWEMRDTDGKIAIPAGEFEEIRPPYRGKCWVKKNGKWGVIELQGKNMSEEEA